MRYALVKFRVYLLGDRLSSSTPIMRPFELRRRARISQRMARWLSFSAEYNFVVHYKPGSTIIIADALSRRPDYDPREDNPFSAAMDTDEDDCVACTTLGANALAVSAVNPLRVEIADAYARDEFYLPIV